MPTVVLLLCAAVACYVLAIGPEDQKPQPGEVLIQLWYPWGGRGGEKIREAVTAFNNAGLIDPETGKRIRATPVFARTEAGGNQKLFMAIVGGTPPEVTFVDGPQVCEYAHRGSLTELDGFLARAGIERDDYYPPCWDQNVYRGHVYALTFSADPNFGFFWSKESFRLAGLDPDAGPRTIEELDVLAERLTLPRDGGYYETVGLIPWNVYGQANSMYTWGWVFGGTFYDYESGRITCDHPGVVKALEWMVSYDRRFDRRKLGALSSGFGSGDQNPLIVGKQSMMPLVLPQLGDLRRYAPGLELGVSAMPYPDSERWGRGEKNSSWVGGWCLAIPRGAKQRSAGFEFIRWLSATDEGTDYVVSATGSFPGYRDSRYIRWLSSPEGALADPVLHRLLGILEACRHQRPVIPVQAFYMDQLTRAVNDCLYKGMEPAEALARAREATQRELDRALLGPRAGGRP
jgi:multiple sugar transport system substrate-binding protein